MTRGGPGIASEVPAKFVMDHLFERANVGLATACATIMLVTVIAVLAPWLYAQYGRRPGGGRHDRRRAVRPPAARHLTWGRIGVYAFLLDRPPLFFLLPLWIMLLTSLKTDGRDPARQHPGAARRPHLRSPGSRPGAKACTGLACEGIQRRLLELGAHPDPVGDPVDPGRRAQRLCALLLAGARRESAVRDSSGRRVHPLPGVPLSAGPPVLDDRHLQLAARHRRRPHHLRHADHDAAVPQLLRRRCRVELFNAARVDGGGF